MSELPAGWAEAKIADVADVNPPSNGRVPSETLVSFVPMSAVTAESGEIDTSGTRPYGDLITKSYRRFREGDVLIAKITPCMENGKAAVARHLTNEMGFGSTEFHVLRPHLGMSAGYLLHFVLQPQFRRDAARNMKGTAGQLRVPANYLRDHVLPVPPLAEQQRIVAAIEEQFSRLDAGVAALERASAKMESLRKAIIVSAVGDAQGFGWPTVTIGDVGEVSLGRQRSPSVHRGPNMRPYLRVANVFEDRIDPTDVMEMQFTDEEFARYQLQPGDVLLNEGQSPHLLGRPAVYRGDPSGVAFTNTLIRFRPGPSVLSDWALLVFRRHMHTKRFMRESRITTNIAHLSATRFRAVEFPLPPLDDQRRIVAEAEAQLSVLKQVNAEISRQGGHAGVLRSSILSAAFSGKLVPQDPTDEPASVLLERIAAERASSNGHKPRAPR